ncbi:hypothetical protein GIB67_015969 [Kingdonia uniflora]|uniref:Uncharacterized protein n=1 Tax=Kingdonia uniflora TaxID=39325 RepID=A0A7J7PDY0_9MAGN|nr:hypothetical protein GIB67_015969 [Kingdonia uniflora]
MANSRYKVPITKSAPTDQKFGGITILEAKLYCLESPPSLGKYAIMLLQQRIILENGVLILLQDVLYADIWKAAVLNLIYLLWRARNDSIFERITFSLNNIKRRILVVVKDVAGLSRNSMANNCFELQIVAALGVPTKARLLPRIQSCTWALPWFQKVKIICGVAVIGLPGKAGIGAVARNHCGEVLRVFIKGINTKTLFFSECEAIIGTLYWAIQNNWNNIWI